MKDILPDASPDKIDSLLLEYYSQNSQFIPVTIEEVEQFEKSHKDLPKIPSGDPLQLLRDYESSSSNQSRKESLILGRAARSGNKIPEEIEKKMTQDREAARKKVSQNDDAAK